VIILTSNFAGVKIASAQPKISNKYGLTIIFSTKILQKEIEEDPANEMIDIQSFVRGIGLDLKCATDDKFMHEKLYP